MKRRLCICLATAFCLNAYGFGEPSEPLGVIGKQYDVKGPGKYEEKWESISQHPDPRWFVNAKFGIYWHWGPYSVPAFGNEWYPRNMYLKGNKANKHHTETYGDPSKFGYKDFIPRFKAEKFDAEEWAELFLKAGAQFAGPVAMHHDGFALWDSEITAWNAADMGPRRDLTGELERAIRKRGMRFVTTFHHAHTWNYFPRDPAYDTTDPNYQDLYGPYEDKDGAWEKYCDRWESLVREVIDKYKPDLLWFDFGLAKMPEKNKKSFLAYYYNKGVEWGREVAVTYKGDHLPKGAGIYDIERGREDKLVDYVWLTDTSVDKRSWCHIVNPEYDTTDQLIDGLVDRVSKRGCLLLNIPPRADGTIPQPVQERLLAMGKWLRVNGEAIYETRPWSVFGEGPTRVLGGSFAGHRIAAFTGEDVRFTAKGKVLYATFLDWPGEEATIRSLAKDKIAGIGVASVRMLGIEKPLEWQHGEEGLRVRMPATKPCEHAFVLKVTLEGLGLGGLELTPGPGAWTVTAKAGVMNMTDAPCSRKTTLYVDNQAVDEKTVQVGAAESSEASFEYTFPTSAEGMHTIAIHAGKEARLSAKVSVPAVILTGPWKFKKGDDPAWKDPRLNDADWEAVSLPDTWEKHSDYKENPAYGWFRKTVVAPEHWRDSSVVLRLGKIDDCDETFFNGKKIGQTGAMPPNFKTGHVTLREYALPPESIRYGEKNVIAVRVLDNGGKGGIYSGPLESVIGE